ncbi:MAG: response regulator [bacterium]|nr:response regulator [bacterium]
MKQAKLLIIEDEALIALDLQMSLRELGYDAYKIVSNGRDAIKSVENDKPDILLLDIHLAGEMDGIDTALKVRSFSDVPIIFITGYSTTGLSEEVKHIKPLAMFEKPLDILKISNVIGSI